MEYKVKIVGVNIRNADVVVTFYRDGTAEVREVVISLDLWPKIASDFYVGRECVETEKISSGVIESVFKAA